MIRCWPSIGWVALLIGLGSPAAYADTQLEEIVVTATKRQQSIQDVSVSVTAIETEGLLDQQIADVESLQYAVPGLTVGNDFSFAKIFVRGIGLNSSFPGLDPSVALHTDGAVSAQAAGQLTSLFDLERVEVLRGPQGSLYGRNATGGSINLVTAKPTATPEGYARVTLGGRELDLITEAALSGPLVPERVLGRIAFRHQDREGYGEHTGTGEDVDDAKITSARAHLQFILGDDVDWMLSGEIYDQNDHSRALKFLEPSFPQTQNPGLVALGLPNVIPDSRNVGGDFRPKNERETWSLTSTLTWSPTDRVSFRSITNYRKFDDELVQDFDVSDQISGTFPPSPTSTTQLQVIDEDQLSEELQLVYEGGRLSGIVGLYYITEDVGSEIRIGRDPLRAPERARVAILADLDVDAYAAFSNFTWRISDPFSITLGARYSSERRAVRNLFGVASPVQSSAVFDPRKRDADRFKDFSPQLTLEYRPSDSLLLFATYSEGFKSGTANLGERSPRVVSPEEVQNFELGVKGSFLDGRISANLSLFDYKVDDAQFDRTFPIPVPPFFTASLENAAETNGRGAEIEVRVLATPQLSVDFSGTFYDIEFDDFLSRDPLNEALFGPSGASVPPADLSGNRPRNTPDWTVNVSATYDYPLANGATLTFGGSLSVMDEQFYTEFENDRLSADKYKIVDARIKYTTPSGRISVSLFGRNLTDEFVVAGAFAISTSRTVAGTYLPPRTYGMSVSYNF